MNTDKALTESLLQLSRQLTKLITQLERLIPLIEQKQRAGEREQLPKESFNPYDHIIECVRDAIGVPK